MNKTELATAWIDACKRSAFVTEKHAVSGLTVPREKRSIVLADNAEMEKFLQDGDYTVYEFEDTKPGHSANLHVMVPNDPNLVPGSGVPKFSTTPTTTNDCFVVPSGYVQGWHVYSEQMQNLDKNPYLKNKKRIM